MIQGPGVRICDQCVQLLSLIHIYKEITPESLRDTIRRMLKEMPSLSEMGV